MGRRGSDPERHRQLPHHPYLRRRPGHLSIAPDGTSVELTTDNGGTGQNFGTSCAGRTTFDDAAALSIVGQAAPFAGTFRPEGSLASLDGKTANGTWRLRITDDAGADVGSLACWSVTITG